MKKIYNYITTKLFKPKKNNILNNKECLLENYQIKNKIKDYYNQNTNDLLLRRGYEIIDLYVLIKNYKEETNHYKNESLSSLYVFLNIYEELKEKKLTIEEIEKYENIIKNILFVNIKIYENLGLVTSANIRMYETFYTLNESFLNQELPLLKEEARIKKELENF